MDGKYNWNVEKKEMRKLSAEKLNNKLIELEEHKQKMEINLRMNGYSNERYGYHSTGKIGFIGGNLKKIRKTIAFIKTILTEIQNV